MWSEPGSVAQSEPSGCIVLGCAVYILRRSDSVPVLSQGRDLRSLLSQEEESGGPGPVVGEFRECLQWVQWELIKSKI